MATKTYRLIVKSAEDIEAMESLIRQKIVEGKNLVDAVVDFAKKEKEAYSGPRLVTEVELMEEAKKAGLPTAKISVIQYRRKGVLADSKGPWYFQNKENKLVYDLDKTLEFLKQRNKAPKSRIPINN